MPVLAPPALPPGIDSVLLSSSALLSSISNITAIHDVATSGGGGGSSSSSSAGSLLGLGFGLGKWVGLDFRDGHNLELLLVPFGLLLLFFGTFLLKPALITCCYLRHGVITGMISTVLLQLSDDKLTGYVLGLCVAWTLPDSHLHWVVMCVFAIAFGTMYAVAPRHVSIVATAYGGTFVMFYGMSLIDGSSTAAGGVGGAGMSSQPGESSFQFLSSPSFDFNLNVPNFNFHDIVNVPDLAFSVLSFLIIGLLGAGVQLMLLASQHQSGDRNMSQSQYVSIP